jgi:hypothetical protein
MRISNEYTSPTTGKQFTDYKFEGGDIVQIFGDTVREFAEMKFPKTVIAVVGEGGAICNVVLTPAQKTVFAKTMEQYESLKGLWVHCNLYDSAMRKGCVGVRISENEIPMAQVQPRPAPQGHPGGQSVCRPANSRQAQEMFRKAGQEELTKLIEFCSQNADVFLTKYGGRDVNSAFILWALSDNVSKEIGAKLDMAQAVKLYTDIMANVEEE